MPTDEQMSRRCVVQLPCQGAASALQHFHPAMAESACKIQAQFSMQQPIMQASIAAQLGQASIAAQPSQASIEQQCIIGWQDSASLLLLTH